MNCSSSMPPGRHDNHKVLFSLIVFEEWLRTHEAAGSKPEFVVLGDGPRLWKPVAANDHRLTDRILSAKRCPISAYLNLRNFKN